MPDPHIPPPPGETRTNRVDLAERSYDVLTGDGIISELGPRLADLLPSRRAFVVYDDKLPEPLVASAIDSLGACGFETATSTVNASESNKTIDTVARILHDVAETHHERTDPIVALGGGITGDVAGFVAASYKRGVPVVQCPTTLLAMVDAGVGGKTGVNLRTRTGLKKNLVGAFWQPILVINDVGALASLERRHLRSGLAECIKHALIVASAPGKPQSAPGELFEWTNDNIVKLRMNDTALLIDLIEKNVAVKAAFVSDDEHETAPSARGGRALLNLGHTYAHAIETIPHLTPDGEPEHAPLQHGEAVAFGLIAAAHASVALGDLTEDDAQAVRIAVERLGLESRLMALPEDEKVMAAMRHDKKVTQGRLRLIVPTSLGTARVVDDPPESVVFAGLSAIRAGR